MVRVLIPSGALGLGYEADALAAGIAARPDIIAIDGGSTDSGPHYLGTGSSKYSRASTKLEWAGLMAARGEAGIPLVLGTAGTCGTDSTVDWLVAITKEIAAERGENLKIAVLKSNQPAERVINALRLGDVRALPAAPEISEEILNQCSNIVALAGVEQIQAALDTGADIVIAGRTTDTAIIAALPLQEGCDPGAAWHGAKIGECGALCATNPQSGVIIVDFDANGFTITPMSKTSNASPQTVFAHMLYENSDPFILYEPGGHLDVTNAQYEAIDARRVRVSGSVWHPSPDYNVKLEGAKLAGYQTIAMALLRDPHYVKNAHIWCDDILEKCNAKVQDRLGLSCEDYKIELRIIGDSATLGSLEKETGTPVELGILGIVTAASEEMAGEIGKMLNPYLLHHPLTQSEEQPTFAFPFSPAEIQRGAIYEFCLNHTLRVDDPMEPFTLNVLELVNG